MLETELIGKTVNCILCRGSILYFNETEYQKFCRHLQFEHSVMYDFDFMLAACKMTDSEKSALSSVFNKKSPDPSPEGGGGGAGDTNAAPASASSTTTSSASKMFKNQTRNKSKLNQRKPKRMTVSGKKQSVGNNVIDVKSFKVTKFSCQKCSKNFKTRTKLMKHKTRKHSSLTRPKKQPVPTPKQKLAAAEAMQQQSVIGAGAAGRAADAVMKVSLFPPSASSTQTPPRAPAPSVTKTPPSVPPPASKQEVEIKIEKEEAEIVDIAPKTPPKTNNDNKTPPPPDKKQKHQFLTEIGLTKNGGSVSTSTSSAKTNVSSVSSTPEVSTPVTETSTPDPAQSEPSCSTCVELANSASKLSRHKRYVHEDKTKSPSTSEKARRESIREAKKASKAESETIAETDPTTAAREDVPPPRVVADTPLRPCLKRSYSVPRRLSISFNESVSSSDQTEEREMEVATVSKKKRTKKSNKEVAEKKKSKDKELNVDIDNNSAQDPPSDDEDDTASRKKKRGRLSRADLDVKEQERQFQCPFPDCGKKFKQKVHQKKHTATHSDEKPFKCNICVKSFRREDTLQRHMKSNKHKKADKKQKKKLEKASKSSDKKKSAPKALKAKDKKQQFMEKKK